MDRIKFKAVELAMKCHPCNPIVDASKIAKFLAIGDTDCKIDCADLIAGKTEDLLNVDELIEKIQEIHDFVNSGS